MVGMGTPGIVAAVVISLAMTIGSYYASDKDRPGHEQGPAGDEGRIPLSL